MTGRRILVTGASTGIGFALLKMLASEGHTVYGCARHIDSLESADFKGKQNTHAIVCDVSDEEQVAAMFVKIKSQSGGLDVCINNAGVIGHAQILDGSQEEWKKVLDTNVIGLSLVTKHAVNSMLDGGSDDCVIMNINSTMGHPLPKQYMPGMSMYVASKHAMTGITSCLRGELVAAGHADKIRVMQISPAMTDTMALRKRDGEEATARLYQMFSPLTADDVAEAVVHAISAPKRTLMCDQILYNTEYMNKM